MPSGVFDRTQSIRSGAWGTPNKRVRISEKDIPTHCLPMLSGAPRRSPLLGC